MRIEPVDMAELTLRGDDEMFLSTKYAVLYSCGGPCLCCGGVTNPASNWIQVLAVPNGTDQLRSDFLAGCAGRADLPVISPPP
jgi:hypothetical protein